MADLTKPFAFLIASRDGNAVRMWSHSQEAIKEVAESTPDRPSVISLFSEDQLASLLPGPHYMDPPDGGSVSVYEQLQRMALDAARYRWLRNVAWSLPAVSQQELPAVAVFSGSGRRCKDISGEEMDRAIDDAMKLEPTHG